MVELVTCSRCRHEFDADPEEWPSYVCRRCHPPKDVTPDHMRLVEELALQLHEKWRKKNENA